MVRSKKMLPGSLATLLEQVTMLGIGGVSETTGTPQKNAQLLYKSRVLNLLSREQLNILQKIMRPSHIIKIQFNAKMFTYYFNFITILNKLIN